MTIRRMIAVFGACALTAGVAVDAAAPAIAADAASPSSVQVLSETMSNADVVTTDQGVSVAVWQAGLVLEWSVQRPGEAWTQAEWMGSAPVGLPPRRGLPRLATSGDHGVTATWIDRARRVVVRDWSPVSGWSKATRLTGLRHNAWQPQIASNPTGVVAISWSSKGLKFSGPAFAKVAIRHLHS